MMMVDDLGGGGVQKKPFCDDVICEQPLTGVTRSTPIRYLLVQFTIHMQYEVYTIKTYIRVNGIKGNQILFDLLMF